MNKPAEPATTYDELRSAIAQRHGALSGRLQQIAEFVLDHPTDVALGTVAEVAQRSGVPPSAIVRFAHALGFGGFTEMQQVFRSRLVAGVAPSYKARLAHMKSEEKSLARPQARRPCSDASSPKRVRRSIRSANRCTSASSKPRSRSWRERATSICSGSAAPFRSRRTWPMCCASSAAASCCSTASAAPFGEQSHMATSEDALVAISFRNYYADTARLFPGARAARRARDRDHRQPVEPDRRRRAGRLRDRRHAGAGFAHVGRPDLPCPGARHRARFRAQIDIVHIRRTTMASHDAAKALAGKVALVTGAGRGLGRAFAEKLAALGAAVAIHGMRENGPAEYGEGTTLTAVAQEVRQAITASAPFACSAISPGPRTSNAWWPRRETGARTDRHPRPQCRRRYRSRRRQARTRTTPSASRKTTCARCWTATCSRPS